MTKEEMQLLRNMMKEEIGAAVEPIRAELSELKEEVSSLRFGQKAITVCTDNLDRGQEDMRTDVRRTRMLVEQQDHKISLIAEQYTDIAEKLDKANDRAAQIDDMRDRLRTLETVVMNHTATLKELRKAE